MRLSRRHNIHSQERSSFLSFLSLQQLGVARATDDVSQRWPSHVPAFTDPGSPSAAGVLELARNARVVVVSPSKCCAQLPDEFLVVPKLHRVPPFAYHLTGTASKSAANWRSSALAAPL